MARTLDHEVVQPMLHRVHRDLLRAGRREHHYGQLRIMRLDLLEHI
jgi:hypothetical protein